MKVYHNRGLAKIEAIADLLHLQFKMPANRGLAKAELGQYQEAIADYDQALHLQFNDARVYHNRGLAKAELGQYWDAIADFDQAIRLQPDYALPYVVRGLAKAELGQYQDAIADLKSALGLAREIGNSDFITFIERKIAEFE